MALLRPYTAPNLTIASNDIYPIGDASQGFVGTMCLHFVAADSFDGDVTVVARSRYLGATVATPAYLPIPYLPLNVAGTAGTYATGSSATVGDTGIILVPATGLTIALSCANWTTGSLAVYWTPVAGAAA